MVVSKTAGAAMARPINRITSDDVVLLRREVYTDGSISRGDAEMLFMLNQDCPERCSEWTPFFVEAVCDYIVHQEKPAGYISEDNAAWLVKAISHDGVVDTLAELELLVRVLEVAKFSPASLSAFALNQVTHAVIDAKGPLMIGGALVPGLIGKAEVDLLRRILHAFGGDGNVAITRAEADVLFTINESTTSASKHPAWNELFVKAMANFLMCSAGYAPPTREQALRRDTFLDRADVDIGGFLSRMVAGGASAMLGAYRESTDIESDWDDRNRAAEVAARRAEAIDDDEVKWLAERIGRDGQVQDNERALLEFLEQAVPTLHADLKSLLDRAA